MRLLRLLMQTAEIDKPVIIVIILYFGDFFKLLSKNNAFCKQRKTDTIFSKKNGDSEDEFL